MNNWYAELNRPPLTPPNWIFGPVWSVLYLMIAVSIVLYVRQTRQAPVYWVYALIVIHVISNVAWTPIFFKAQRPGWALVDIIVLDVTLAIMIAVFWKAYRPSSILLMPYMAWVSFATYLNAGFFWLNRTG